MRTLGFLFIGALSIAAVATLGCSSSSGSGGSNSDASNTAGETTAGTAGETTGGLTTAGGTTEAATTGGLTTAGETTSAPGTTSAGTTGGGTTGGLPTGPGTTGAGTTGGTTTGGSCADILTCLESCTPGDQACGQTCLGTGSQAAQQEVLALMQCIQTSCPTQDQACIQGAVQPGGACSAQMATCVGGGGGTGGVTTSGGTTGGGAGNLSCSGIVQCIQACGQTDEACAQACANNASPDGGAKFNALIGCLQTACPQADQTCIQGAFSGACAAEVQACGLALGGGKPGLSYELGLTEAMATASHVWVDGFSLHIFHLLLDLDF